MTARRNCPQCDTLTESTKDTRNGYRFVCPTCSKMFSDKKRLKDVIPMEALRDSVFENDRFNKYLDYIVLEQVMGVPDRRFPFKHKNINVWWILEKDIAVGWNENPSIGWSFPIAKLKVMNNG